MSFSFQTIANIVKREFSLIQEIAEGLLEWAKEKLFITLSVSDIIWGYNEPLISKFVNLAHDFGYNVSLSEKFGIFVGVRILFGLV